MSPSLEITYPTSSPRRPLEFHRLLSCCLRSQRPVCLLFHIQDRQPQDLHKSPSELNCQALRLFHQSTTKGGLNSSQKVDKPVTTFPVVAYFTEGVNHVFADLNRARLVPLSSGVFAAQGECYGNVRDS